MRKKRTVTRKRSALRWLAALCLLVLFCFWTGLYGLTPQSALRQQGRDWFLEELTLVDSVKNPYETEFGAGRVLAAENDGYLLLGLARWTPWRGWQPGSAWPRERTDGTVDAMFVCYSWDFEEDLYPCLVFGIVNDQSVDRVTLHGPDGRQEDAELRTGRDGRRYFLEAYTGDHTLLGEVLTVTALDGQGEALEEQELLTTPLMDLYD